MSAPVWEIEGRRGSLSWYHRVLSGNLICFLRQFLLVICTI